MIPSIDLELFVNGSATDRAAVGAALDVACREVGFLTVVGHGVGPAIVNRAWQAGKRFFAAPITDKMSVAMPRPGYPYGYSPVAGEALSYSLGRGGAADLKESYVIGPIAGPGRPIDEIDDPDERAVYAPNLWPAIDGFRPAWEAYYQAMSALAARLMSLCAVALGLGDGFFEPFIDRHGSAMRMLHYPHQAVVPEPGQLRAGAHTDYGTLTILAQDAAPGGLEVFHADGRWVPVPYRPDSFVVNLGDLMARWTNDRWRSTLHRVVNPPITADGNERFSIAFFHNANWDAEVTCLTDDETAKYPSIRAGAHLMGKFRSTVIAVPVTPAD